MAIRIMDSIKTANDSTEFPVSFGNSIWLNKDKSGATEDYSDLQTMYNNDELGNGGSAIQVDTMPIASEYPNEIVQYVGKSGTYQNGYFYQSISDEQNPPTYSWVQKNVQPNAESFTFNEDDFNIDSSTDKVSLLPSRRVFNGSKADWDLLSVAEKTQYGATAFTDDDGGMDIPVDVVESGNMHAVTSNAVANFAFDKSKIRIGEARNGSPNNDDWIATFDTPFPDDNYIVIATPTSASGSVNCPTGWYVSNQTSTGFRVFCNGNKPLYVFYYIAIHN